jgi:hypothetical protein
MKSNYTLRYLDSTSTLSLASALTQCANNASLMLMKPEDFIANARNVDYPVVHWKIRTSVGIIAGYDIDKKPRVEKMRFLIEGYIEPVGGFMVLRSKNLARGKSFSRWFFMQKNDPSARVVQERENKILDGAALDEAMRRVKDESGELLTKVPALHLPEPVPPADSLESPLNLV